MFDPQQVKQLTDLRASGPAVIARMVQKCGPQIFACVNDPDCKAALDCLQACSPTDQASTCAYVRPLAMITTWPLTRHVLSCLCAGLCVGGEVPTLRSEPQGPWKTVLRISVQCWGWQTCPLILR